MTRHHGYALVERHPRTGNFDKDHDVVIVEQLLPDGSVRGPFAQANGQARTRASRRFGPGHVRHIFRHMPKRSERWKAWCDRPAGCPGTRHHGAPRTRSLALAGVCKGVLVLALRRADDERMRDRRQPHGHGHGRIVL